MRLPMDDFRARVRVPEEDVSFIEPEIFSCPSWMVRLVPDFTSFDAGDEERGRYFEERGKVGI